MGNIYENKFMKRLQRIGEKFAANKAFAAISGGMMICLGIILAGAVFQILAVVPTIFKWYTTDSSIYKFLMMPYNMTMGLIALIMAFAIAYTYSKMLKLKAFVNGANAMILFLLVAAPVKTVTLADDSTFSGLDTTALGAVGIFSAILIAIFSVKLSRFFEKHHIYIKMPDVVPQFLQDSFASLVPFVANLLIWHTINTLIMKVFTVTFPVAFNYLLSVPLKALTSVPGMLVVIFIACLLWTFGIHGTMVVYIAIMPAMIAYISNNASLVAEGKLPVFAPVALFSVMSCCGGTGNTFPLVIMGLRSKSEQIKAVSKAALLPGIFNINEPATFGFPIMYNPIMAIPFILNPLITALVIWLGYSINFFKPSYVMIGANLPIGVAQFLGSMAWQNILMPVVAFVIGFLIYRPFFKVYEHQLLEKEVASKTEESAQKVKGIA